MNRSPGVHRAREGICLVLNNQSDAAEELFDEETDDIHMAVGKCFVTLINALLSYETEKLDEAVDGMRELEKRCARDVGWIKSVKDRVFGSSISLTDPDVVERLEEQIVLADSQVCVALLTFLQQDLSSYVRGGWRLRKAWKVYQHTYSMILDLYRKTFPSDPEVPGSEFPSWCVVTKSVSCDLNSPSDWSVPSTPSQPGFLKSSLTYLSSFAFSSSGTSGNRVPPDVVARLMASISFGYGIFQLCVSLLPPSLLRLIHVLGFDGDRQMALNALMFARLGDDMRGPLASLALLWYHTIVRPFLALDSGNMQAGVDIAVQLYEESKTEFSESALFLFFLGRVNRLKGNIGEALTAYEGAIEKSTQREVQLLCLHEVGWCYLIRMDWGNAFVCFEQLRAKSRWSQLLYTYLSAVCVGAQGDSEAAKSLFQKIPKILKDTRDGPSNIDTFLYRRMRKLPDSTSKDSCTLLALEMLYLWSALTTCSTPDIITACENCSEEPMVGLSSLLQGANHIYLGNIKEAEECLRRTLKARADILASPEDPHDNDDHISAFAALELATTILLHNPETEPEGKALLLEAREKYKGYDFESKVTIRIHAALKGGEYLPSVEDADSDHKVIQRCVALYRETCTHKAELQRINYLLKVSTSSIP